MSEQLANLPPELQARINAIVEQANAAPPQSETQHQVAMAPPASLATRPPSLMDHIVALRQEVSVLSQQTQATAQVTEAVGNAVGQLYQMFCSQTETTTYSSEFQAQRSGVEDDY